MKIRNTLIKLMNNGKTGLTIGTDGYVLDSNGRKLFVLKKEPIQLIQSILENYEEFDSTNKPVTTQVVKYTGKHQFITENVTLSYELLQIIYCSDNIKFPQPDLVEVLDLIQADLAVKKC